MSDWQVIPNAHALAPNTLRVRERVLFELWWWMESRGLAPVDLQGGHTALWIQHRLRDIAPSSLATEVSHVKAWYKMFRRDLWQTWKDDVALPGWTSPEPRALTEEEDAIVMMVTRPHPGFALVALCRLLGMRWAEAAVALWDWIAIHGGRQVMRIQSIPDIGWEPKGYKVRSVPIPSKMNLILRDLHRQHKVHGCRFIAAREWRGRWDRYTTRPQPLVELMQRAASLPQGQAFHVLRKTFATRAATNGVRLEVIQRWLGHSNITTTRRYIDSTLLEDVGDIEKVG